MHVKETIGFIDGQTTNPSLIAKNPGIRQRIASGHNLSAQEEKDEYRKIVQAISPLVGDAGVSIEVFADIGTTAEEMLAQGDEMFSWIPNAHIKHPCTRGGLRTAEMHQAFHVANGYLVSSQRVCLKWCGTGQHDGQHAKPEMS